MPVMLPARSERNRTPNSTPSVTARESSALLIRNVGTVSGVQMEHGQTTGVAVVNVQVTSDASGLPVRSVTPLCRTAVYVVASASREAGTSSIVWVADRYDTVAAIGSVESCSSSVRRLTVSGLSASLKRALTCTNGLTPIAPAGGVFVVTNGAVESAATSAMNRTSTK